MIQITTNHFLDKFRKRKEDLINLINIELQKSLNDYTDSQFIKIKINTDVKPNEIELLKEYFINECKFKDISISFEEIAYNIQNINMSNTISQLLTIKIY